MGWGMKAIEIRSVRTGALEGVFMHKRAQKMRFLCERNNKVTIFLQRFQILVHSEFLFFPFLYNFFYK